MAKKRRLVKAAALFVMPAALVAVPVIAYAQTPAPAEPQKQQASGVELKLLTPRAGETLRASTFALDVSFQSRNSSPVVAAELWVDGVQWTRRNLDTPQLRNVLSFDVEGENLTPGTHLFTIKVFNEDGAVTETQLQIIIAQTVSIPDKAGATGGPEFAIQAPLNGKKVSGVVELVIDAKPQNGTSPYITIYIDKQFKTLKNFAPYTYTWDTTTVPNGYHLIEVMGYLESTNRSTTRRIRVYVDNPGGATVAMKDVPNLDKNAQPAPVTKATENAKPLAIPTPTAKPAPVKPVLLDIPARATVSPVAPLRPVIAPIRPAGPVAVAPTSGVASESGSITIEVAPRTGTIPAITAPKIEVTAPKVVPAETTPVTSATPAQPVSVPPTTLSLAPMKSSLAVAKPAAVKVSAARPKPMVPMVKPSPTNTRTTPKAVVRPAYPAVLDNVNVQPVAVAFDGRPINFDVAPRIEDGLPLAPFRQIFEHTGGQVMWMPEIRTVRAVGADREVVIPIGQSAARVNGKNVTLDRPAFIDRGRTIVPLSFVGQALDVDVQYDPATGRVSITSKH